VKSVAAVAQQQTFLL